MAEMESWRRLEKEIARKLKGMLTPGSGNQGIKGDIHTDLFVIEAKWRAFIYGGEYYLNLEKKWLTTIAKQAKVYGKEPLLAVCVANINTYYLIRHDFWLESEGRLESVTAVTRDMGDRKQFRMYAKDDFAYTIFDFDDAGAWIALPESDLMFLVQLARQGEVKECKEEKRPQRSRPEMWEAQRLRERKFRDRQKAQRKELYRKRKEQEKNRRLGM